MDGWVGCRVALSSLILKRWFIPSLFFTQGELINVAFEKNDNKLKMQCTRCLKNKDVTTGYFKANTKHCKHNRVPICRDCCKKLVNENRNNMISFCESIDLVFIQEYWEQSLKSRAASISNYFRIINMRNMADMPFSESNFDVGQEVYEDEVSYKVTVEAQRFWGKGLAKADYMFLQSFYDEFANTYSTDTPVQINLYKNIAKAQLQANKAFESGDVNSYDRLMKSISSMLADSNLKIKDKADNLDDTLGLRIRMIENEHPIPKVDPRLADVDKIGKYFKRFFLDIISEAVAGSIDSEN